MSSSGLRQQRNLGARGGFIGLKLEVGVTP
jgi:hypothetical protein